MTSGADVDLERLSSVTASRTASAISNLMHPVVVVVGLLVLVGWRSAGPAGAVWGLAAWFLCAATPFAIVLGLVRGGRLSDAQVVRRVERGLPVGIGLTAIAVGGVVLHLAGAPRPVLALVAAQLVGLALVGIVTLVSKASVHTAVVAAGCGVLGVEIGGIGLAVGVIAVLAVAWARVRGGRHTRTQVATGAVLGLLSSVLVYAPLR